MAHPSTRILVLGAGIAGLLFTLRLAGKVKHSSVQITLVDESDTFMVRPRLHEFATNQHVSRRSLPKILRHSNVQFLQGRITSLDPSKRSVTIVDQQQQPHELGYDYLVYALGSMTDRHSVAGVADYAYSLSASGPLSAVALRDRLPALAERSGQVVVCGGGATGIETAAQVASVYPRIKVSLLTQGSLASSLGKPVAEAIRRRLVSLGVQIVEHSKVSAVHAHSVVLEQDRELACDLCIWTAGFVVQPLARLAGLAVNERDQILVDPFLRSVSHPEIYAIGDAASPVEEPGVQHVRMSANTAGIMGAHGADCLSAILTGKKPKPLSFAYLAQAIALGRHHGIFFLLTPEDQPRPPYITGWLGSLAREGALRFVVTAILVQRRLPGLFVWPGKGRYEQAQHQKQALEEFPELSMHPEALALLRTIIADAHRFPQLTETLRSTIHERAAVEVSLLLERARINGVALRQGDTMLMTRLFVGSLMTYVMFDGLLHPQGEPALPDAGQIEAMVTLFLSAIVDPRELERNQ